MPIATTELRGHHTKLCLTVYQRGGHSWNAKGNLTSDGENSYTYDSENRMTGAVTASGSFSYTFDAFGRRVRKVGPGVDVSFVHDGVHVIEERDGGDDSLVARYVYGAAIDECVRMERGGASFYYHRDRLGSVVNLSNSSGDLVESYKYDAWGNVDSTGSVGYPYFFTGRRYDSETGLYLLRAELRS